MGHHQQIEQKERGCPPAAGFRFAQTAVRLWQALENRELKQSLIRQIPIFNPALHEFSYLRTSVAGRISAQKIEMLFNNI
jgi:hypothetical protein